MLRPWCGNTRDAQPGDPQRALIAPARAIRIYPFLRVSVYKETRGMDARKERGLQLAQHGTIVQLTQGWRVPASSGSGSYFVRLATKPSCTCPDFEYWQLPCKHSYAVEYLISWKTTTEGTQTVTTKTETVKVTYKQNWPAYNAAQTEEKERFVVLLDALCKLVDQPLQGKGRPRLPLADMILAALPLS